MSVEALVVEKWERKPEIVEVVRFKADKISGINKWLKHKCKDQIRKNAPQILVADGSNYLSWAHCDIYPSINEGDCIFMFENEFKILNSAALEKKYSRATEQSGKATISELIDELSKDFAVNITLERKG